MTVFFIATPRSTTTITQSGQPAQTRPTTSGAQQAHQAPKRFHLSQELPSAENLTVLVKIEIFDNFQARNFSSSFATTIAKHDILSKATKDMFYKKWTKIKISFKNRLTHAG